MTYVPSSVELKFNDSEKTFVPQRFRYTKNRFKRRFPYTRKFYKPYFPRHKEYRDYRKTEEIEENEKSIHENEEDYVNEYYPEPPIKRRKFNHFTPSAFYRLEPNLVEGSSGEEGAYSEQREDETSSKMEKEDHKSVNDIGTKEEGEEEEEREEEEEEEEENLEEGLTDNSDESIEESVESNELNSLSLTSYNNHLLDMLLSSLANNDLQDFTIFNLELLTKEKWKLIAKAMVRRGIPDAFLLRILNSYRMGTNLDAVRYVTSQAAKQGKIEILNYLKNNEKNMDAAIFSSMWKWIARGGYPEAIEWAKKLNFGYHKDTAEKAVKGTNALETLQWLHENGCLFNPKEIADKAALYGKRDVLEWLETIDPELVFCNSRQIMLYAVIEKHINVLEWGSTHGVPYDYEELMRIASDPEVETWIISNLR
jgi:AAA ATPase containing von Willebrand factor type A (vWA) domain